MQIRFIPSRKTTFVVAVTTAVALLSIAGTAIANHSSDRVRIEVNFADLNLETDAGIRQLHARLRSAAREACDVQPLSKTRSLRLTSAMKACYRDSLAAAVAEIDNDRLTALVAKRASTPKT
ncbi:MAG: UrcA family protein [Pseudomonadota bacterium]